MFGDDRELAPDRLDGHVRDVDAYVSAASKTLRAGLRVALFFIRLSPDRWESPEAALPLPDARATADVSAGARSMLTCSGSSRKEDWGKLRRDAR